MSIHRETEKNAGLDGWTVSAGSNPSKDTFSRPSVNKHIPSVSETAVEQFSPRLGSVLRFRPMNGLIDVVQVLFCMVWVENDTGHGFQQTA